RTAELEAVIRAIPDGVVIGDESGLKLANDPALAMLGLRSEDALGGAATLARLDVRALDTGRPIPPEEQVFARALGGATAAAEVLARNQSTGADVALRSAAAP